MKYVHAIFFVYILIILYICTISNKNRLKRIVINNNESSSILATSKSNVIRKEELSSFDKFISEECPMKNINISYTCLEKLSKFEIEAGEYELEAASPVILYHTFWTIDETKSYHLRVLILQILSFLATQNINRSKLLVWIQNPFSENINKTLSGKFGYYLNKAIIEIKLIDFSELCSNSLFRQRYKTCISPNNQNSVAFSDFVRFLILYSYGGIYTDGDVIYLRDMMPFWKKNFVYRWSYGHSYNTAIMGLKLNRSKAINAIYEKILNENTELTTGFHPRNVTNVVKSLNGKDIYDYEDFEVFLNILFDPSWLCNDKALPRYNNKTVCQFSEFYDTIITADQFEIDKFYKGAFTYHLHLSNCGACLIGPNSYFHHFEKYFIDKLINKNSII